MKSNSEHSKGERIVVAIISFIAFFILAFIIRLFAGSIALKSTGQIIMEFLPVMLASGSIAAFLAYFFPKQFKIILIFIPIPGGGN